MYVYILHLQLMCILKLNVILGMDLMLARCTVNVCGKASVCTVSEMYTTETIECLCSKLQMYECADMDIDS